MPEPATLTAADFDRAVAAADGLYLVEFGAAWCAPCTGYAPLVADVVAASPGVGLGTVDIEAEPELAERLGVRTVPAVVAFRGGEVTARMFGVRTRRYLVDQIARLAGSAPGG
jgi:thioredoxin-like negative regulator of GroEL